MTISIYHQKSKVATINIINKFHEVGSIVVMYSSSKVLYFTFIIFTYTARENGASYKIIHVIVENLETLMYSVTLHKVKLLFIKVSYLNDHVMSPITTLMVLVTSFNTFSH